MEVCVMEAGKLRHRLIIENHAETSDGAGGFTVAWNNVTTVWGSIEPLTGIELIRAQKITAETTHKVTVRYRSGLDTSMQIKYGTRVFQILAILNPEERNVTLEILCKEWI